MIESDIGFNSWLKKGLQDSNTVELDWDSEQGRKWKIKKWVLKIEDEDEDEEEEDFIPLANKALMKLL